MKKYCILSVTDKTGLDVLAKGLCELGYEILSTGGTARYLQQHQIPYTPVSEYTGQVEIMDGRVKTLHPKIHGGILARLQNDEDIKALTMLDAGCIDVVVVNLYPFLHALKGEVSKPEQEMVELIDIGGPCMLRAAAKNFERVYSVIDPKDYSDLIFHLKSENEEEQAISFRKSLSAKVFAHIASYDLHIASYLSTPQNQELALPKYWGVVLENISELRYGENPHQRAGWYAPLLEVHAIENSITKLQGKELSYNNLNDALAASDAMLDMKDAFPSHSSVVIIKHANPCGVAYAPSLLEAFKKAVSCDPVSAFGGIISMSAVCTADVADEIVKTFFEVVIAPSFTQDALDILATKKNLRVIRLDNEALSAARSRELQCKSIVNSYLVQNQDTILPSVDTADWKVGDAFLSDQERNDATLAFVVCKHVKSNAIVIAKEGMAIGIGAGQMNRVDSSRIAIHRAKSYGHVVEGAVVASDAFLPFRDNIDVFSEAGISLVVQPGGSIRDEEVVAAVQEKQMRMVCTGVRFFRH